MTAIPDPKKDHIECSISDTDLFTPAFVQSEGDMKIFIPSPNLKTTDQLSLSCIKQVFGFE